MNNRRKPDGMDGFHDFGGFGLSHHNSIITSPFSFTSKRREWDLSTNGCHFFIVIYLLSDG